VAGLTLDYCVRTTVLDALQEGFSTILVEDGVRAVLPENTTSILEELRAAGAETVRSNGIQ
jgi:nicotinamidase/pyrazinamidase